MLLTVLMAPIASGHEFWIAPHQYTFAEQDEVTASIRVGQMFQGTELPYISSGFSAMSVLTSRGVRPLTGVEGDLPAIAYTAETPGLHVLRYDSTANTVTYDDWDQFLAYLSDEGLPQYEQVHRDRGLPEKDFDERYVRFAKSLVQIGSFVPGQRDAPSGAPFEIVVDGNPYQPGLKRIQVQLLRHNAPVAHRQLAVFRYDGAVSRTLVETDASGRASLPVDQGGTFLLSATDLQPLNQSVQEGPVWLSQWASLTFGLPIPPPSHPLDPLSNVEILRTIHALRASGHTESGTRLALLTLREPDKQSVLGWREGDPFPRRSVAVVRTGTDVFEAVIDLDAVELESWNLVPGVQPPLSSEEWALASHLTKEDQRWLDALRTRGYHDVSEIFCEALPVGYFGAQDSDEPRLVRMPCYDIANARTNVYGRPIEGLISVVDLDNRRVDRVIDTGALPVSTQSHEFSGERPTTDGTAIDAKPTFRMNGRVVQWQGWSFHIGFDQRFGSVVSLVRHEDGDRSRMVLFQGHVSEVFVPYMDADEGWYFRTPMDVGEYGLGMLASPLTRGIDCPSSATYLDASVARPNGSPYLRNDVICVFERDVQAPLWRHREALNGVYAGRKAMELVVRFIPAVGNYDYIVDWVFTQKGEIRLDLGATGIDAVKGVAAANAQEMDAEAGRRDGMLVAPNLLAVHHDHYFSIRLDLDIDGSPNTFVREQLQVRGSRDQARSVWQPHRVQFDTEGAVSARQGPELWRIESTAERTLLGHRPSYQLVGTGVTSMLAGRDWPHRRAAFAGETLWITQHKPGELFAGGQYPNQGGGNAGLPAYVNGERVENADVVAWYTIGFNHLTRPEDWPVLPTIWHSMTLRPYGFFERNPSTERKDVRLPRRTRTLEQRNPD